MQPRLIVVANRLPVSVSMTADGLMYEPSPGGMAAALAPILRDRSARWVGYTGLGRKLSQAELTQLHLPRQLVPVNLPKDTYKRYYYNFANGSLWPLLHGFEPRRMYTKADWQAVLAVTAEFATAITAILRPDDVVWIHDFHLIMLPKMLRDMGCANRIGYFLHVPFAGAEHFKKLPHHSHMLASLAAIDLVGLQTGRDVARFTAYAGAIPAKTKAFPVGIDYQAYERAHATQAVKQIRHKLEQEYAGKTVIFSLSRLDYTKGILHQLEAVKRILAAAPSSHFIYKLAVAPSREDLAEYSDLKRAIAAKVRRINREFGTPGWQPIEYTYANHPFSEVIGWYCRADVALVTPLIDGMNLVAKEYIAAHPNNNGALVLSQTAGAATQLGEAVLVDPTSPADIARGIQRALAMAPSERQRRHEAMRRTVQLEDAALWATTFLAELK